MSNELTATSNSPTGLREWIHRENVHSQLAAAIGDVMNVDTFIQHMMVAFQDPKVKKCSDQSKFTALNKCAALGLLPTLGQVSLIPYGNEIKAMPEWEGYKALMERHPDILEIEGHLIHVVDTFQIIDGVPQHTCDPYDPTRTFNNAKDIRGGYCRILYTNGRPPKFHHVPVAHIVKAQACAQTQEIWTVWYGQMALKTLYRDCYARRAVPVDPLVSARLKHVVNIDDVNFGNDPLRITSETTERHRDQARKQREADTAMPTPEPESQEQPPEETDPEETDPPAPDDADQGKFDPAIPETYRVMLTEAKGADALRYIAQKVEDDKRISDKAITAIFAACGMER